MDDDLRSAPRDLAGAAATLRDGLALADVVRLGSTELIDLIAGLERLKGAAAACQARAVVAFTELEREAGRVDGVAAQVGLAMRQSPAQVVSDTGLAATIPADEARVLVRDAARVFVRRLYADPERGDLVGTDSRRRVFDGLLRRFLVLRDQRCRTPWCHAPVRHVDHVLPHRERGLTSAANAQGLCEACNQSKERAGLRQESRLDGSVLTTTPTGHTYRGHRPRPPGPPPRPQIDWSRLELLLRAEVPA